MYKCSDLFKTFILHCLKCMLSKTAFHSFRLHSDIQCCTVKIYRYILLMQDRYQWKALMDMVMNEPLCSIKGQEFID
jgi:hypothetical protein